MEIACLSLWRLAGDGWTRWSGKYEGGGMEPRPSALPVVARVACLPSNLTRRMYMGIWSNGGHNPAELRDIIQREAKGREVQVTRPPAPPCAGINRLHRAEWLDFLRDLCNYVGSGKYSVECRKCYWCYPGCSVDCHLWITGPV